MAEEWKRSSIHRKLQAILDQVNNHGTKPLTYTPARELLTRAEELLEEFKVVQASLEATAKDETAFEVQANAGDAVEQTFSKARQNLRTIIELSAAARGGGTGSAAAGGSSSSSTTSSVRLPSMTLPTFDGKYSEWLSFKDLFAAAFAKCPDISGAQKLQFLKGQLTGEPANLIRYLTASDSNYVTAWQLLDDRYNNTRELVHFQIGRILDLKAIKGDNARELQTLIDTTNECIHALSTLGCPTDQWDDFLVVVLVRKLDADCRREWARSLTTTSLPKYAELEKFMSGHIRGLQAASSGVFHRSADRRSEKPVRVHIATESGACHFCNDAHHITDCKEFREKSPAERSAMSRRARLCFNCLKPDHVIRDCKSSRKCKKCGRRHHTLLHEDKPVTADEPVKIVSSIHATDDSDEDAERVVITAVTLVPDKFGKFHPCRVVIDPCSQADLITTAFTELLGLERSNKKVQVLGVGGAKVGSTKGKVNCNVHSRVSHHALEVSCHVMDNVTGLLPTVRCKRDWRHLEGLSLADPRWNEPAAVDILLGVKYFNRILLWQRKVGNEAEAPVAWETIFGWGIAGVCSAERTGSVTSYHVRVDQCDELLRRFWEVEEPPKKRILTQEEKKCEEHFLSTYQRDENGRFHVRIPFVEEEKAKLGKSKEIAKQRLRQVERRLQRKPELRQQYVVFMKEYEALGHMTKIPATEAGEKVGKTNYLCHHFVTNESSTTTKLRVVFDGSCKTSTGVSLNDAMMVGATIQDDLFDLLLRFRLWAIVLKADIAKMFRQFLLHLEDADFHRILWRESPDDDFQEYRLNTVTYGTGCATWLATRCIYQLALDCKQTHPNASSVMLNDEFIDDVITGKDARNHAINLYKELRDAMATAGLDLRKWTSNEKEVLHAIPEDQRETKQLVFEDQELVKALGVQWHPSTDQFKFKVPEFSDGPCTKRSLLSDLAKVFDPLGLIGCVTLRGKFLLQDLWKLSVGWDEHVTTDIEEIWMEYRRDLLFLQHLTIPRRITINGAERMELHAFGDSSERGYGGNVYLRNIFPNGSVEVRFITSKTRVAPVRQMTLPRLELCAAVLTAELVTHVKECLKREADIYLWSDSTITLTWIAASPRRWKTFIANRVATIQELTPIAAWKHVAGTENPADLSSRGCSVQEILDCELWWKGPRWLSEPVLPSHDFEPVADDEKLEERKVVTVMIAKEVREHPILIRYSSFKKLRRITAWYIRYLHFTITKKMLRGGLNGFEIRAAGFAWVRNVQENWFPDEYKLLSKGKSVSSSSKLKSFFPYLDNMGIIRIYGRLGNSAIPEEHKHQAILPKNSHLSGIIIDHFHQHTLHGGFQLTANSIQSEYWIIGGRDKIRHFVRSCLLCRRHRAKVAEQLMGILPSPRVTPCRPFLHTGVDYAGPFVLKDIVGRVPKTFKGYLCLFVCMVTKAVYLEAVTSLSTEAFIAAFRRFAARRGLPSHVYSDNGTNFAGADKELQRFVQSSSWEQSMGGELSAKGIEWHFNPPSAPHAGGLWEAGVKSAKHHLRRVMGNSCDNLEQFATLLAQVEAVLNSRPLYARSADPDDFQPLTPGHFLIGTEMTSVPDLSYLDVPTNRLSQFQRLQQQFQHFWSRWSREYLNTLQQRNKWMWEKDNVTVGDLVLLVEESPPATWKMARVVEVQPGADDKVRTVTVRTAKVDKSDDDMKVTFSMFKRPITKLVPLLNDN